MSNEIPVGDYTKLMLFFGRVSEVHIENLKAFPFIYYSDVTEVKLDYSVNTERKIDEESLISFEISISKENNLLSRRFEGIEKAVRALFWKEIKVKVTILPQNEVFQSE